MPRRRPNPGICAWCGGVTTPARVIAHLAGCAPYQAAIAAADQRTSTRDTIYHLRAQDAHTPFFWLDLAVTGTARLHDLDHYLRAIWLECCEHLSQFSHGRRGAELAFEHPIHTVFQPGSTLTHVYDFGTSSETTITCLGIRHGAALTPYPIARLMRNQPPDERCTVCQQPAVWFCAWCFGADNQWEPRCDVHAAIYRDAADDDAEVIRAVNSPRVGMCGYNGPAEPPY
ncbi:hypothetical protein [Herpetosiphon giganteus]|uniref:hypothetical protein n=1 Tax=Herpetosiphon giganteus TaxID=2029754 RepID=UPI0019563574|nr:hypothetical protein [Herpetosiphon giganteus]MBM7845630.1 hypothetical protein [Herpetosiphon giganteus]